MENLNYELINKFYKRLGINVDFDIIDEIIMSDNNILRPVVGHAFEFNFSKIVKNMLHGDIDKKGGDTDIDLVIIDRENKCYEAQVKTLCKTATRINRSFGVNLHKTHGIEKRPNNLYPITWPCPICQHEGEEFPDFLILPHPTMGVLIVPKNKIPENTNYPGHFADPAIFNWNSEWLNRWDLIGFPNEKGKHFKIPQVPPQPILTNVCAYVNLTYEELLNLWLEPDNFRMIDMNLRGNLREPAMNKWLKQNGIETAPPVGAYPKYDILANGVKIQIKGASKAKVNIAQNLIGVEVMGSHGNGAIRRYGENEFEYLGIVIEPMYINPGLGLDMKTYHYAFIPIKDLPLHYRNGYEWSTTDKIYDVASLCFIKKDNKVYLKPRLYRNPPNFRDEEGNIIERLAVSFRNNNIYEIDYIPNTIKQKELSFK